MHKSYIASQSSEPINQQISQNCAKTQEKITELPAKTTK